MTDRSAPDGWTEGDVDADGVRLHYYRSGGDGRPFVFAHGITSDGRSRVPLVEDLAAEYDVVTYDARGHGRSAAPEEGYAPADQAGDLLAIVDALDLEEPVLYGHSMGGTTVAVAAAARPDLPHAVVMEDPALLLRLDEPGEEGEHGDSNGESERAGADAEGERDESDGEEDPGDDPGLGMMLERIRGQPASSPEELRAVDPELAELVEDGREHLAGLLAEAYLDVDPAVEGALESDPADPEDVFPDVAAPTLVLKADADSATRERHHEVASLLPDGRLVHVEDAGHCVLRDEYDRAYGTMQEFLDEQ